MHHKYAHFPALFSDVIQIAYLLQDDGKVMVRRKGQALMERVFLTNEELRTLTAEVIYGPISAVFSPPCHALLETVLKQVRDYDLKRVADSWQALVGEPLPADARSVLTGDGNIEVRITEARDPNDPTRVLPLDQDDESLSVRLEPDPNGWWLIQGKGILHLTLIALSVLLVRDVSNEGWEFFRPEMKTLGELIRGRTDKEVAYLFRASIELHENVWRLTKRREPLTTVVHEEVRAEFPTVLTVEIENALGRALRDGESALTVTHTQIEAVRASLVALQQIEDETRHARTRLSVEQSKCRDEESRHQRLQAYTRELQNQIAVEEERLARLSAEREAAEYVIAEAGHVLNRL